MDLIAFARQLKPASSQTEFINLLKQVVDLDQLRNLTEIEAQNMYDATQFLTDYMLLVQEFLGQSQTEEKHPFIVYNGPYIENQLTRSAGKQPDFSALETYGIES